MGRHCKFCFNIQLLPYSCSIRWWLLPEAITNVVVDKWWFSNSIPSSTSISGILWEGREELSLLLVCVCVCVCVYVCLCACDLYNFMDSYLFYRLLHIIVIIYSDAQIVLYLASGSPFEPPLVSFCWPLYSDVSHHSEYILAFSLRKIFQDYLVLAQTRSN